MFLKAAFDWVPHVTAARFYFLDVDKTSINVTISLGCRVVAGRRLYSGFKNVIFNVQNPENVRVFFHFFQGLALLEPYISIIIGFKRKVASVRGNSRTSKMNGIGTLRRQNFPRWREVIYSLLCFVTKILLLRKVIIIVY